MLRGAAASLAATAGLWAGAPYAGAQPKEPSDLQAGRRLFQSACASCHGDDGAGGLGPSLVGVGAASAHFQLSTGRMPLADSDQQAVRGNPAFNDEEIDRLVAYIAGLGSGPAIPQVEFSGTNLSAGQSSFITNCSPCHGATGNGGATGRGAIAPSLYAATSVQVAEATITGPGEMPKFAFSDDERNDIVRFVTYLQDKGAPGGADLGGIGPVPEGFVGLGVGIGALLLIALYIGKERATPPGGVER